MSESSLNLDSLVKKYRLHDKDTASPFFLIIGLTDRIKSLTQNHTKFHKKDHSAKRTVVRLVAARKRFQRYMKSSNKYKDKYQAFMADLGLRA